MVLIVAAWLGGLVGAAFITIGILEASTGRAVINLSRINWSSREASLIGITRVVQGLAIASYPLIGALALGPPALVRVAPWFWVGHWWGPFAAGVFWLVIVGTLMLQAVLDVRHKRQLQKLAPR